MEDSRHAENIRHFDLWARMHLMLISKNVNEYSMTVIKLDEDQEFEAPYKLTAAVEAELKRHKAIFSSRVENYNLRTSSQNIGGLQRGTLTEAESSKKGEELDVIYEE